MESTPAHSTGRPPPRPATASGGTPAARPAQLGRHETPQWSASTLPAWRAGINTTIETTSTPDQLVKSTPAYSTSHPRPATASGSEARAEACTAHEARRAPLVSLDVASMEGWDRLLGAKRDDLMYGSQSADGVHSGERDHPTATRVLRPPREAMLPPKLAELGNCELPRPAGSELPATERQDRLTGVKRDDLILSYRSVGEVYSGHERSGHSSSDTRCLGVCLDGRQRGRDDPAFSSQRVREPSTPADDTSRARPASCHHLQNEAIAGARCSVSTRWLAARFGPVGRREAGSTDRRDEGRLHSPNGPPVQGARHDQQAE